MRRLFRGLIVLGVGLPTIAGALLILFPGVTWFGTVVWLKLLQQKALAYTDGSEIGLYWIIGFGALGVMVGLFFWMKYLTRGGEHWSGAGWPELLLRRIEKSLPARRLKAVPLQGLIKKLQHNPSRAAQHLEEQ